MYKKSLMTALENDYEDAAQKYLAARNVNAEDAERYLCRMKLIGKNMKTTRMMMDGTVGKIPLALPCEHTTAHTHTTAATVARI